MLNIYLDDVRETPDGFTRCYWPEEVIGLLKEQPCGILSLDHDLGDDTHGTGYDVLLWLEEAVFFGVVKPPQEIRVHSSNSSARLKMDAAIKQVYEYAKRRG